MGWSSWFTTSPPDRATQVRSGAAVPTRSERQKCWAARDAFFACLDQHAIIDATKESRDGGDARARKVCPQELARFETDCAAQWVQYFKEWRVADYAKRKKIEQLESQGATRMDTKPEFGIGNKS